MVDYRIFANLAAANGQLIIFKYIIKNDLENNPEDNDGNTPHIAWIGIWMTKRSGATSDNGFITSDALKIEPYFKNDHFRTISSHFFADCMYIFHKN